MISNNYFNDNDDLIDHFDSLTPWNEVVDQYEQGFEDFAEYQKSGKEELAFAPGHRVLQVYLRSRWRHCWKRYFSNCQTNG